ncbi:MAG TPA: OB-fold domain-containing protein [Ramlibacter sp.]|nr:OB-fold domain-containing protein [Ramlibacter sp.]
MQDTRQQPTAKPPEYFPPERPWEERDGATLLVGMRCSSCGTKAFPARTVCSKCGADTGLEPALLSPRGTLYTYSEVHIAPKDFPTPYVIGYVDLQDGVRVFGQIEGTAATLRPDQQVETTTGVVRRRADGTPVISYKFRSTEA